MRLKSELYPDEQSHIRQQVIHILELDESNSTTLYELDNNKEKQSKLMALIPPIRKFFNFGKMIGVSEPHKVDRPWLSIIKHMTRQDYEMLKCDYRLRHPELGLVRTKRYVFQRRPFFLSKRRRVS